MCPASDVAWCVTSAYRNSHRQTDRQPERRGEHRICHHPSSTRSAKICFSRPHSSHQRRNNEREKPSYHGLAALEMQISQIVGVVHFHFDIGYLQGGWKTRCEGHVRNMSICRMFCCNVDLGEKFHECCSAIALRNVKLLSFSHSSAVTVPVVVSVYQWW